MKMQRGSNIQSRQKKLTLHSLSLMILTLRVLEHFQHFSCTQISTILYIDQKQSFQSSGWSIINKAELWKMSAVLFGRPCTVSFSLLLILLAWARCREGVQCRSRWAWSSPGGRASWSWSPGWWCLPCRSRPPGRSRWRPLSGPGDTPGAGTPPWFVHCYISDIHITSFTIILKFLGLISFELWDSHHQLDCFDVVG